MATGNVIAHIMVRIKEKMEKFRGMAGRTLDCLRFTLSMPSLSENIATNLSTTKNPLYF